MVTRVRLSVAAAVLAAAAFAATAALAGTGGLATYEVTITNLTGGQALTPPLVATHRRPADVFEVGEAASFGVKEIAENGNLAPLAATLGADKHVSSVVSGAAPLVPAADPGGTPFSDTVTLTISGDRGAKYLSWVSMLICTNDGFTGVDSIRLPKRVGDSVTVSTAGYDAGTEVNTEDFDDLVPPCQRLIDGIDPPVGGTGTSDPALAEGGVITHHAGIQGGADLTAAVHGWVDPVATIEVTRVG
jgi:hypothetical protein